MRSEHAEPDMADSRLLQRVGESTWGPDDIEGQCVVWEPRPWQRAWKKAGLERPLPGRAGYGGFRTAAMLGHLGAIEAIVATARSGSAEEPIDACGTGTAPWSLTRAFTVKEPTAWTSASAITPWRGRGAAAGRRRRCGRPAAAPGRGPSPRPAGTPVGAGAGRSPGSRPCRPCRPARPDSTGP